MNPPLSIVIATINDNEELGQTIHSIRETSPVDGSGPEIVIVDDCGGGIWFDDKRGRTVVLKNRLRCGVGPSRHVGALASTGDWILFTDSHMRFAPGWWEAFKTRIGSARKDTLLCATCLQFDRDHPSIDPPMGEYNGATYNWLGPDRNDPKAPDQILECVWLKRNEWPEDGEEIPAVMGAGYFISRDWYYWTTPLRFLHSWGCDELLLSMKTWLSGGRVEMARTIRIGHRFLVKGETKKFNNPLGHVLWNKVFCAWTLFPPKTADFLESRILNTGRSEELRDREACRTLVRHDWPLIETEMARNRILFRFDANWLADKFGLALPK